MIEINPLDHNVYDLVQYALIDMCPANSGLQAGGKGHNINEIIFRGNQRPSYSDKPFKVFENT
jgi:hypothetical protein